MKYVVKAAGISHAERYWKRKEEFPANVKGFDYEDALAKGVIAENPEHGIISKREPAQANSFGLQKQAADRDVD